MPMGSDGHFSQAVWGDKTAMVEGTKKHYKTTSNLHTLFRQNPVEKINHVSAVQWECILATARTHIEKSGAEPKSKVTLPPAQLEPQSDEDWELPDIDPDTLIAAPTTDFAPEQEPEAATSSATAVTTRLTSDTAQLEGEGNVDSADGMVESGTDGDSDDNDENDKDNNEDEEEEREIEPETRCEYCSPFHACKRLIWIY